MNTNMIKLSQFAKNRGITYNTMHKWYKQGFIIGAIQLPTGTILVPENAEIKQIEK